MMCCKPPPDVSRTSDAPRLSQLRRADSSRRKHPAAGFPLATTNSADLAAVRNSSRHCAALRSSKWTRKNEPILLAAACLVDGPRSARRRPSRRFHFGLTPFHGDAVSTSRSDRFRASLRRSTGWSVRAVPAPECGRCE